MKRIGRTLAIFIILITTATTATTVTAETPYTDFYIYSVDGTETMVGVPGEEGWMDIITLLAPLITLEFP